MARSAGGWSLRRWSTGGRGIRRGPTGTGTGSDQAQRGGELLRAARWIPRDGKTIQGHGDLRSPLAIQQLQVAPRGQKPLQALTGHGPPSRPHHQQHQARMHQQGTHPPGQALAGRQAPLLLPHAPALRPQLAGQGHQGIGPWRGNGFRQMQLAQLSWRGVVDPAQGGLQGRPLAAPAAEQQGEPQQGQQRQKPSAGIHMVELETQQGIRLEPAQPGGIVVALVVEGDGFLLRNRRAEATGDRDQQQQHNGQPQVGQPGQQAQQRAPGGRWGGSEGAHARWAIRVRLPVVSSTTPLMGGIQRPNSRSCNSVGRLAATVPASSRGST